MSDLSKQAEELLRIARAHETARRGQKELVRAALLAAVPSAAAGVASSASAATKAAGVAAKAGSTVMSKVLVGALVTATAIGGGTGLWALSQPTRSRPQPPVARDEAPRTQRPEPTPVTAEPTPTPAVSTEVSVPAPVPRRATHRVPTGVRTVGGSVEAPPAPAAPVPERGCTLNDELELLRAGQTALREGRPSDGLNRFESHRLRCGTGTLGEEREAGRIIALSSLGRLDEAANALEEFKVASPRSPHLGRVEQALREARAR